MGSFRHRAVLLSPVHRPEERPVLSQEFAVSSGQRAGEVEQQNVAMEKGMQEEQCKGKYRSSEEPAAFRLL